MKRLLPLLEYEIEDIGMHCVINIYVAGEVACVLDTHTKYEETAEEELTKYMGKVLYKLFDSTYEAYPNLRTIKLKEEEE